MRGKKIEMVEKTINEEKIEIYEKAKKIVQSFWENRESMLSEKITKNSQSYNNKSKMGCAVNLSKDGSVRIYWFMFEYYTYAGIKDGVRKMITRRKNKYITRPKKGFRYNVEKLKKYTVPEEYSVIEIVEGQFELLRYELSLLSRMSMNLKKLNNSEDIINRKLNIESDPNK